MTSLQKVIKYLAIAFAIFLIVTIFSTILAVLFGLTTILGLKSSNKELPKEMILTTFENANIEELEIDVTYADLTIKSGESLQVETNNKNISSKQEINSLEIKETKNKWFSKSENEELIIYIPENLKFEEVKVNTGVGKINIDNLITEKLSFELGAGETQIQNINVSKECEIEGGAGKITIESGIINNLDLDMGVGEINLTSTLTGKNEINAGIGNLEIELTGEKESYEIKANKGLGSVKTDGKEMVDGEKYGDGENTIKVDGGIGNITIDFKTE